MTTDAPPRRRRWPWAVAALLLVAVSALPATYLLIRWQGFRELAAVRAELSAENPDWRMPDLFAARNERLRKLPVNSADTVTAAAKLLPAGWDRSLTDDRWYTDGLLNRQPSAEELNRLRGVLEEVGPTLRAAKPLHSQPDGGTVIVVPDLSTYSVDLSTDATMLRRQVAGVLNLSAAVAALDGDSVAAVERVQAMLNVARSIGDEPLLIAQLVRIACTQVAVRSAERVLALCEPGDELARLQAAFEREAGERFMQGGLRGELASVDQVMTNLANGSVGGLPAAAGTQTGMGWHPFWPHDHAAGLRLMRAAVADAGRPFHARTEYTAAERALLDESPMKARMSQLLAPAVSKVGEADGRVQAALAVAVVAVACERHRRATGSWPATLDDLPKSLLGQVPMDPFDGRSVRYKRTGDGAVVYSVGPNRVDDGGNPPSTDSKSGDVVFRLFDPAARKLPALPPTPADTP